MIPKRFSRKKQKKALLEKHRMRVLRTQIWGTAGRTNTVGKNDANTGGRQ